VRCIGGPLDGRDLKSESSILLVKDHDGRYIRWWDPIDYPSDWFQRGLPEPPKPERYYLWQPAGEEREHPAVLAIRAGVTGGR
jgi:hypothetical protein